MISICFSRTAVSAESLSYSGRLVQTNGAPVTGTVNLRAELAYTNSLGTVLCSDDISGVILSKGVFHIKLDFSCTGGKTLTQVLSQAPAGESVAIQITDVTNSKSYSFQAIHAIPYANVARVAVQLDQNGAGDGEFLKWDNSTKQWKPGTVSGASGGTVTSVSVSSPLSVATPTSNPSITIQQANGSQGGYLSSADWNAFNSKEGTIAGGTALQYYRGDKTWQILDTSAVPENVANLYFTNARALGVPLTGFTVSSGAITATDTLLSALEKTQGQINSIDSASNNYLLKNSSDSITGSVNVAMTGSLTITNAPALPTDAANKQYVDTKLSLTGGTLSGVLTLDSDLKIKGGSNYVTLRGHASSANYNFIFPSNAGSNGQVLQTDGSGNLTWSTPSTTATPSGTAGGGLSGTYPNPAIAAGVDAAKLSAGNVSNTEFDFLDGVTSSIQTQLAGKQAVDATLTSLAGFNANGFLVQTAADTFTGRTITGAANRVSITNGNGVTANPIVDVATALLPSPVAGDAGKVLKATGADAAAWTALDSSDITSALAFTPVNKAGDTISGDLALNTKLRLRDSTTNYVELKSPTTVTTTYTLTFPAAKASVAGQMLTSDTSGNLSWTTPSTSATPTGAAGGDLTGTYPNPTIANGLDVAKLSGGIVSNTEFDYLDGVTSSIQTQFSGKQPLDTGLTNFAAFNTNGILVQTANDTYAGRSIAGTANRVTVTNGDGVSGNPTLNLDTTLLPSPVAGDAGKFLKASGANASAWTSLASSDVTTALGFTPINKAGDTMATGTFTYNGTSLLRTLDPIGPTDVATKQYVDSFGQWTKSGSDIYRSSSVGINTSTPGQPLEVAAATSSVQMRLRRTVSSVAFADIGVDDTKGFSVWPDGYGTTSANPKFVITPTGNVGIGNTAPTFRLGNSSQTNIVDQTAMGLAGTNSFVWEHLVGDTASGYTAAFLNSYNAAAAHGLLVKTTGTAATNKILTVNSGGTDRMAVLGNGNVGIGTNNPGANLDVAGDTWHGMSSITVGGDINTYYPLVVAPIQKSNNFEFDLELTHGIHEDFNDAGSNYIRISGNLNGWGSSYQNYRKTVIQKTWGSGTKYNVDEAYLDPWNNKIAFYVLGGRTYHFRSRSSGVYIYGWYSSAQSWDYGSGGVFSIPAPYTTTSGSLNQSLVDATIGVNVGIGVTNPTYQLQLGSDSAAKPGTSTWTIASDIRLKDVRAPFKRGLNELLGLNTIYFNYKKDNPLELPSDKEFVGIKAQDAKKFIPESVSKDEKGFLHVTNDAIIWTAVNSIKELYYKIVGHDKELATQSRQIASKADQTALELSNAKIKKLESENAELKARLDKIEKALNHK